jgi:hypothetical protein
LSAVIGGQMRIPSLLWLVVITGPPVTFGIMYSRRFFSSMRSTSRRRSHQAFMVCVVVELGSRSKAPRSRASLNPQDHGLQVVPLKRAEYTVAATHS